MPARLLRIIVLLLAVMALSTTPAKAGYYSGYAYIDTFVDIANGPNSSFSITPATNITRTGSASGNATYSDNVAYGFNNSLPPPLFPGVYNSSQTNGTANLPPGSMVSSVSSIETQILLYFSQPTLLAISFDVSTITSVQTSMPYEFTASFASASAYFDGAEIYSTSSTAGSFGNNYSYTTTSGGSTPIMYVFAHAGINELDAVTYANGYAYTIATPPPPSVPEPGSLGLATIGISMIGLLRFGLRLCRQRRGRALSRISLGSMA